MAARRVRLRPPGVKTGSTIGPLGPFRGTLGIHWVLGAIAVGLVIVLAGMWFLFREPPRPFQPVEGVTVDDLQVGMGQEVLAGIYVAKTADGRTIAVSGSSGCPIQPVEDGYLDCAERRFGLDGQGRSGSLTTVPLQIHDDTLYLDTSGLE